MRVAIVGSGIAGLVCAQRLHRRHEIVVFEAADWIGGHTHTVRVMDGSRLLDVDTGFIVYNERTYPGFTRLLAELGVATRPTQMGFSVSCERTGIEYSGSVSGLFARRRNVLRPDFLRMVRDLLRFQREAPRLLAGDDAKVTLGDWLDGAGYSRAFQELHLLPMAAAIWSARPELMRAFPARSFVRFFENHGLLRLHDRPVWRVVEGGSARYVEALVRPFRPRVRLSCPVTAVHRRPDGVHVTSARGTEVFDRVVLATHSDQALRLLRDPSDAERRVLGALRYQPNEVALHTDSRLLPRRPGARAAWNFHRLREDRDAVTVTYSMNRLQGLDAREELCVTLNRTDDIDPARLLGTWRKDHPLFDAAALAAQGHHDAIDGVDRTHFCGAYWGHGFHEDGLQSALRVVARIEGREEAPRP